jgi:hypothetical protein
VDRCSPDHRVLFRDQPLAPFGVSIRYRKSIGFLLPQFRVGKHRTILSPVTLPAGKSGRVNIGQTFPYARYIVPFADAPQQYPDGFPDAGRKGVDGSRQNRAKI